MADASSYSAIGRDSPSASPNIGPDAALDFVVAVITGIACFNVIELILLLFVTFSRWSGLYFWSLLIASFAVLPYSVGFLVLYFQLTSNWLSISLITVCAASMLVLARSTLTASRSDG